MDGGVANWSFAFELRLDAIEIALFTTYFTHEVIVRDPVKYLVDLFSKMQFPFYCPLRTRGSPGFESVLIDFFSCGLEASSW